MGGHHSPTLPDAAKLRVPSNSIWAKLPIIGLVLGVLGLGGAFALGSGTKELPFSYLVAYMYWLSIAIGALFFVVIQFAVKAGWSATVRRVAENAMVTLPVFALLFIPILLNMETLYGHWLHPHGTAAELAVVEAKSGYLNKGFFLIRAGIYLTLWSALAVFYYKNSTRQDETGDLNHTAKLIRWAGPTIAVFALTITFAAMDWVMSLDPHWFSTMFGVYYFAGSAVGIFAFMSLMTLLMSKPGADLFHGAVTVEHRHDLAKLTFAFTVFWTYIAFSQYFLIWYANIPEETMWYEHHLHGNWLNIGKLLIVGHFVFPFFFMMSRHIKRNRLLMGIGVTWLLFIHFIDLHWVIRPLVSKDTHFSMMAGDILCFVGVGGIFLAGFGYALNKNAVVAHKDPYIDESLAFDTGV